MGMDKLVVLTSFVYEMDAQVLVSELQAGGIDARIRMDDCGGMRPGITNERGVEVLVDQADLKSAQELIASIDAEQAVTEGSGVAPNKKPVRLAFIVGIIIGMAAWSLSSWIRTHVMDYSGTVEVDTNKDGQKDALYEYDEDGYTVRSAFDNNHDGEKDDWYYFRQGALTVSRHDLDFNGIVDETIEYENRNPVVAVIKPNGSEVFGREQKYEFGIFHSEDVDTTGDGKYDTRILYDPFQKITSRRSL